MSLPTLLKPGSILSQKWMSADQKKKLQTLKSIDWIIEYLEERSWNKRTPPKIKIKGPGSRVGVFRSGTGTGKSTVFPPAIFAKFFEERGLRKTIICTQPTVATATDIPYQIALYNKNLIMGQTIGFQTGSLIRKPVRGVLFATIGILLQHLKLLTDEEFMKKYSFIILDEIHNRSVETDTTLFYLRRFLQRNYSHPECPFIILTSGTFEPEIFMDYFECPKDAFLDILGSSFPIEEHFTPYDVTDYMQYAIDMAEKIHIENIADVTSNGLFRDILIFVQGSGQIKAIVEAIHKLNAEVFSKGLKFAQAHSAEQQSKYKKAGGAKTVDIYYLCPVSVTSDNMQKGEKDYQNTFSSIDTVTVPIYKFIDGEITDKVLSEVPASRRVIVATNAIETGLTIDTLKYCIDTGFVQESQYNPNFGVNSLISKSVTQSSARQRRGRVGRKDPGVFYACYTKETYDALIPLPFPEIVKSDMTVALLDIMINETDTKLQEVILKDLPTDENGDPIIPSTAFQMNKFDQRWYDMTYSASFDMENLAFIQSPAADSYMYGLEKLRILGYIDHEYKVTMLGWFASRFRKLDIENTRMILAGYHHGANVIDLITMTCFLQTGHKLGIKKNKYKPRNPLGVPEKEVLLYYNMLFMDEFIEYLFIWNDFMDIVEELGDDLKNNKSNLKLIESIGEWCEENKFDVDAIFRIVAARDEIIGDMLNVGLNPFYNGYGLPRGKYNLVKILNDNLAEGMEEVRKLKKCIYEGYRLNLYVWNDGIKSYVSMAHHNTVNCDGKILKGVGVGAGVGVGVGAGAGAGVGVGAGAEGSPAINNTDPDIKQNKPQKIIVSSVTLRAGQNADGMYEFNGADVSVLDGFVDIDDGFYV